MEQQQVKKETALIIALLCLVIGFLGGIVFSVYKSPAPTPVATNQAAPPAGANQQAEQQKIASQILATEREVAANPGNVEAWTQLGHLYFDSDQPEKAIKAYSKSLELKPDNPDVLTDLGVMYRRNNQIVEALASFDKAMTINPKHEQSRFNKGIVLLYDKNDPEAAIKIWEEMLALNPLAAAPNGMPVKDIIAEVKAKAAAGK